MEPRGDSISAGLLAALVLTLFVLGCLWLSFVDGGVARPPQGSGAEIALQPLLAKWEWMHFYPLSILYILLDYRTAVLLFGVAHVGLAMFGLRAIVERWNTGVYGPIILVAVVFGVEAAPPSMAAALAWMPAMIVLADRARVRGGRDIVFCAGAIAFQFLTGATAVILLSWTCLLLAAISVAALQEETLVNLCGRFFGMAGLAIAFAATQIIPLADVVVPATFEQKAQPRPENDQQNQPLIVRNPASPTPPCRITFRELHASAKA